MAKRRVKRRLLTFIDDHPSPNFSGRNGQAVQFLVLHYTGIATLQESLDRLTEDKAPRVSSHYLTAEDGVRVYRLVDEKNAAWHAGHSYWSGASDLNASSVGIENQNPGDRQDPMPPWPKVQTDAVIDLCRQIIKRHNIRAFNVVAHSDIAPDRKQDPGHLFDWPALAAAGVGVWPAPNQADYDNSTDWNDSDVLRRLRQYGYDPGLGLHDVLVAFQRHFHPEVFASKEKIGVADPETKARLANLLRRKQAADKGIATRKQNRTKVTRKRKTA